MKHEQQKKPFAFRLSPEAKLNWLEEANQFVNDFVPRQKLERWKKIKGR